MSALVLRWAGPKRPRDALAAVIAPAVNPLLPFALPRLAIAADATTPDPGFPGALAWSTILGAVVVWNGANWTPLSGAALPTAFLSAATSGLAVVILEDI